MEYELPIQGRTTYFQARLSPLGPERVIALARDITSVKNAERRLAQSEAKYRSLFFLAPTPYLILKEGRYVDCNQAALNLLGCNREELLGKNPAMISPETQPNGRSSEGYSQEFIAQALEHGSSTFEWVHSRLNGARVLMQVHLSLIDYEGTPALLDSWHDITQQREQELEVRRLSQAIEQSPVALVVTDLDGVIQHVSQAFTSITGYTAHEAVGQSTRMLKSGLTSPEVYAGLWKTLKGGNTWRGEWINRKKNGELYPERASISPICDDYGHIVNYLAIKEDLTLQKKAEEDRIARIAAESANHAKSAFLSNMSHEIRTPLNAILGFSQILGRDSALNEQQKEQVQIIARSGHYLLQLINSILDLSKIEAGQTSLENKPFNLHELLDDLDRLFTLQARGKGLELRMEKSPGLPVCLIADGGKLRQVLVNLLGNACKFTAKGHIQVRADLGCVDANPQLNIEVEDSGPGIPPEDLETIFESFQQSALGRETGGTGLGLTISRNLIRLMGGEIEARNLPQGGCLFSLHLPVALPSRTLQVAACPKGPRLLWSAQGREIRVLVVDDHENNRLLLKELLVPLGLKVQEAVDGYQALDIARTWLPQLILLDLRMPGMNGYHCANLLRAEPALAHTLIFAITASAFADEEEAVYKAGFDEYVRKPFDQEEFLTLVAQRLELETLEESCDLPPEPLDFGDLSLVPESMRKALMLCVEEGDMKKMHELLPGLESFDAKAVRMLKTLANAYDYERLLALLEKKED